MQCSHPRWARSPSRKCQGQCSGELQLFSSDSSSLRAIGLTSPHFFGFFTQQHNKSQSGSIATIESLQLVKHMQLSYLNTTWCNIGNLFECILVSCFFLTHQNEIGAAAYGTLSLINHSCDPNVVRHYHSSHAVVRTIRWVVNSGGFRSLYSLAMNNADSIAGPFSPVTSCWTTTDTTMQWCRRRRGRGSCTSSTTSTAPANPATQIGQSTPPFHRWSSSSLSTLEGFLKPS